MTDTEVAKLVAVIAASWATPPMTADRMRIYERMLKGLPAIEANAAVERLLVTVKFTPSIAEIRETAHELMRGDRKTGGEAWGDVLAAVRKFGIYRRPVFGDPLVEYAVKQFGWENICNGTNQVADRARFIELYEQLERKEHGRELSAALPANRTLRELANTLAKRLTDGTR